MRIRSIRIHNHPGVGDLQVDFCAPTEAAPRTIIMAGENGLGKTVILNAIQQVFHRSNEGLVEGTAEIEFELVAPPRPRADANTLSNRAKVIIGLDANRALVRQFAIQTLSGEWQHVADSSLTSSSGAPLTSFLDEASVSFSPKEIQSITGRLPEVRKASERSGGDRRDLATEIAQLFADIRAADNEDLRAYTDKHGNPPAGWPNGSREYAFGQAFASIFPAKRLGGVEGGRSVFFEEDGRKTLLKHLSTGEKQIVFRGSFFLARRTALHEAVVMTDEPELSLHPHWQSKIVDFYERILFSGEERNAGQLIVATHSPYVVHGSPLARHIVLARNAGRVVATNHPVYPGVTAEVAIQAFDAGYLLSMQAGQAKPLLLVEGTSDKLLILEAWERLRASRPMPFEMVDAGGASCTNVLLRQQSFLRLFADQGRPLVGLFDFDNAGFAQWKGLWGGSREEVETSAKAGLMCRHRTHRAWAALLPIPEHRKDYANSSNPSLSVMEIEFLFDDDQLKAYAEVVPVPGGSFMRIPDSRKNIFAEAARGFAAQEFAGFEPLLDNLERILTPAT